MSSRICPVCSTFQRQSRGPACTRCGFEYRDHERLGDYERRLEAHRASWNGECASTEAVSQEPPAPTEAKDPEFGELRAELERALQWRQWDQVGATIRRLIELETDPARVANYYYTLGVVQRDELDQPLAAIEEFEAALDADPKLIEAFEAIDGLHTARGEWKELERAYRRMLRRIVELREEMPTLTALLWRNLGDVYRDRLGHVESALAAYEAAETLDPTDRGARIVGELRRRASSLADREVHG